MVSKNNFTKRMEETSDQQSHFGIRKLTIGAVSVLLGTTLWINTNPNVVHADTKAADDKSVDESHTQKVDTSTPKNAVVEVNNQNTSKKAPTKNNQDTSKQNINQKSNNTNPSTSSSSNINTNKKVKNNTTTQNAASAKTALQIQKQKAVKAKMDTNNQTNSNNKITKSATTDALNTNYSKPVINPKTIQAGQTKPNNKISKTGLSGKTEKVNLTADEIDFIKSASPNIAKSNNLYKYSAKQLKQLLKASLAQTNDNNSSVIDLNTFTPNFNHAVNNQNTYNGQLKYAEAQNAATGDSFIYTTDLNDPGKTLYFYRNGSFVTQLTNANASIRDYFNIGRGNVYNYSAYQGGEYNLLQTTQTINGYIYNRFEFIDKENKRTYYAGEVRASSNNGKFNTYYMNGMPVTPLPINDQRQPSLASPIVGSTNQTVTYINADTGQIMKQFTSKDTPSGSSYNLTDAALNKITFDGKTYDRVTPENVQSTGTNTNDLTYTSSNISSAAINKVLFTNNGASIKAGDIWDEPLTGTVGSSRKGDITMSETTFQMPLVYISQQTDSKGTVDMNTYTLMSADTRTPDGYIAQNATLMTGGSVPNAAPNMDGLSGLDLPTNGVFGGGFGPSNNYHTGSAVGMNGSYDGHQDFVFFYRPTTTPTPTPTPSDSYHTEVESKVIHRTINYYDKVTGQPIPASVIKEAGSNVTNPTLGDVTFTRSKVYDQNNKFVGYGTIVDGKYVPTDTTYADGWTTQSNTLAEVISPNLTSQYYTAPTGGLNATASSTQNGSEVPSWSVQPTDSDRVYNIYYGHQTEPINNTSTVKRIFHYIFTDSDVEGKPGDGSDKTYSKAPQTVTFKETGTKDLLTGQETVTWTPESGVLEQFTPQEIPGYTLKYIYNDGESSPVKDGAVKITVTPNSPNHSSTFIYDPDVDVQKARVTIVDMDENNKELTHFTNYNGKAGEPIKFTVNNSTIDGSQQALTSYLNSGYVFVKAVEGNVIQDAITADQITGTSISSGSGKDVTVSYGDFWNKPAIQYFTIYLKHGKSEHVEKGTTTSTVHYLVEGNNANKPQAPKDNVQTVDWTKTDTTDLVTGTTTYGDWTTNIKQYKDVSTPTIQDYTPSLDNVVGEKTEYGKNPYTIVTYTPNSTPEPAAQQKATIQIIDKTEDKLLGTFNNDDGVAGSQITFQGLNPTVQAYLNNGYVFDGAYNVTDGEPGVSIQDGKDSWKLPDFDDIKNNVQSFKIYLIHGTKEVKVPSTAQVHYIMSDGSKAPADSPKQTITFTNTIDAVTGEVESSVPDKSSFTPVDSPQVSGYTPSQEVVTFSQPVAGQNQLVNVIYTPESKNVQYASLKIVDKTENKVLVSGLTDEGPSGSQITFPSEQSIVQTFLNNGYKFDNAVNDATNASIGSSADDIKFPVFDNDPSQSQNFTIYLVHETAPVNPDNPGAGYTSADLQKSATRVINYLNESGNNIAKSISSTVTFIGQGIRDKVTNKLVTVDKEGNIVNEDGKLTWTYTVDNGKSEDGNSYEFPATQKRPTIEYNNATYIFNHVDSEMYDGGEGSVKAYKVSAPSDVNNLTVNVIYNLMPANTTYHYSPNPEEKTVTRTINYYDKVTGQPIPASLIKDNPVIQNATITRQIVLDSKGNVVGYGSISEDGKTFTPNNSWSTDNKSWSEVVSPDLTKYGYTAPDVKDVAHVTVNSSTKDQTINVYYGHETIPVTPNDPQNPNTPINPSDPDGPKYPNGVDKNQLNRTVTRVINYVDDKGKKVDGAPDGKDTYKQEVTFTRTAIVDKVTGQLLGYDTNDDGKVELTPDEGNRAWSPVSATFKEVVSKSPKELGYTSVDIPVVAQELVIPSSSDTTVTVVYSSNVVPPAPSEDNQIAQLTIIDRNDPQNLITLNTYDTTGKSDTPISFSGAPAYVGQLVNMGYKLDGFVSDTGQESDPASYNEIKFGNFDNNDQVKQKFILYVVHTTTTVTPKDPGKPGEPVNPNDPDGPKYPAGTAENDLVKNASQTILYHYSDNSKPDFTKVLTKDDAFTRTITFDNVTGKFIKETAWTPDKFTFDKISTPVEQGYHANKAIAGGLTATAEDPNVKDKVIYYPNGKIVPVDPEGNHIPGTDTPSFPTDPNDPTKVNTGIIPNVPDTWTPKNPNQKPGDPIDPNPNNPSENVPVPFTPITPTPTTEKGSITVIVYDTTDNKDLPEYGKTSGNEDVGTKFTYDKPAVITSLEDKGYKIINPQVAIPAEITKGAHSVTIYVEHGTVPVNPENPGKPGEPINPNDPNGPKYPTDTGENDLTKTVTRTINYVNNTGKTVAPAVKQTVKFTESGVLDKVTGRWITPLKWNKTSEEIPAEMSPTINGYHVVSVSRDAEGNNVKAVTLSPSDSSYNVTVTYAPNGTTIENSKIIPSSQIVKFVDESGKEIYQENKQTSTFTYTGDTVDQNTGKIITQGTWNEQTHTYNTVSVPVIDGYVAVSGYTNKDGKFVAGGLTATHSDPNVEAVVVYAKIGKIVPVDPNGKDIPDAPTPTYKNDPNNPTKVIPNEPVPSIPGYTPKTPTVTPNDPTKDTPVPYTPVENEQGQVIVVVHDNTTNTDIPQYGYNSGKQKVGDKVDYDKNKVIADLENQGYKVINPQVTIPSEITKGNHKVTIYVEHGLIPVNPENPGKPGEPINPNDPNGPKWPADTGKDSLTRTGTQTIHYTGAGSNTPKDSVETTKFSHDMVIDKVTGKIIKDDGWIPADHKFGTVNTPVVEGYHADKKIAGGLTVTPDKLKAEETVTYSPNGHIVPVDPEGKPIPNAPTPQYPTNPNNPTEVTPNESVPSIPGYTPETPTITPQNPGKDTPVIYTPTPQDKGQVIIVVHDNTTNTDIPQYGYNSGEQKVGDKVNYDKSKVITDLENQGYKVINPQVAIPNEITKGNHKVTIYVEHGLIPVNPENPGKPGEPINPNDPNGPKWPADTGKDSLTRTGTQTVHYTGAGNATPKDSVTTITFDHHLVVDKVTGKIVKDDGWTPSSQSYKKITSPTVSGFTPDKTVVGGDTITSTDKDMNRHYTVVYTKDQTPVTPTPTDNVTTVIGKQTIRFVDGDDNDKPLLSPNVQTHTFTITNGIPDQTSFTFGTIKVPVIDGYVASVTIAGGKTVTPADPDANIIVVYHKIGKIIPVDKDHNPIPDVDTPQYKNDPDNPTKVVPDEPVPTIDGYTPSQNTVTPTSPTKDTEVVYTKDEEPSNEPNEPDEPSTPDEPEPTTPTKHHHKTNNKPKPSKPWNTNNTPHAQNGNWSNNISPHAQNSYWNNNIAPHAQSVNGWSNNIGPHGEHIDANGDIISASGIVIGYIDKNGNPHYTKSLPQTSSNDEQTQAATLLGAAAVELSMIGLAGVKKHRKRD